MADLIQLWLVPWLLLAIGVGNQMRVRPGDPPAAHVAGYTLRRGRWTVRAMRDDGETVTLDADGRRLRVRHSEITRAIEVGAIEVDDGT